MSTAQYPVAGDQKIQLKSGRKPLQTKNSFFTELTITSTTSTKPKQEWLEISLIGESNKENHPIPIYANTSTKIESLDASLAEELSAIRRKLERLRHDRERTEKMLKERDTAQDTQMEELRNRGEIQKKLEIEVDRSYRLNELKSYCMRISPIRSLREKETEKKNNIDEADSQELKAGDMEESVGENKHNELQLKAEETEESVGANEHSALQSPSSSSSEVSAEDKKK